MIRQNGFTLIETVIFILVLAIGLVGIVNLTTTATKESGTPLVRERTLAIAHAYMDEIISKRWDENTPLGGGCVDTDIVNPTDSCTLYCAALTNFQCVRSKCRFAAGSCQAANTVSPALAAEEGAGNRIIWDDVDDYSAYGGAPETIDGTPIAAYAGYTTLVTITQTGAAWNGIPAADVRRIQVDVSNPLGETLTLVAYRVNF